MFKKANKLKNIGITEVRARIRGYILDSQISDPHELSVILGCSPQSDELQEMEEKESDKRTDRISYLTPLLYSYAHIISEGATEYQRINTVVGEHEIPDEIWSKSRELMEHMSMSALLGAISQLVDLGLLSIPKEYRK